ncbi:45516_t:CDS:2, partial [Gigaspora margarita]
MENKNYLAFFVKKVVREKLEDSLSAFVYVCRRKGHLAHSCPFVKDQGHERSLNNKTMDIRRVEFGKKDREGLKRGGKIIMKRKVDDEIKRVLNVSIDDLKQEVSETSYYEKFDYRELTECKEALDAACNTWLRKVEAYRRWIGGLKQMEGLVEKKDEDSKGSGNWKHGETKNNDLAPLVEFKEDANTNLSEALEEAEDVEEGYGPCEHTWKYRNKEISLGRIGDEAVGNILGVNVVVCGIEVKQPLYVVRELNFDVVLGMA